MQLTRREVTAGVLAGAAASLAYPAARAATPPNRDPLWYVNPALRDWARQNLKGAVRSAPFDAKVLADVRRAPEPPIPPLAVPLVVRTVPGLRGAPPVRVYVVNPKPGTSRPAILHTHGGGFISGSPRYDLSNLAKIAAALDAVIVSVDYRLAPETRYAGAQDDNYAGLLWLWRSTVELGADPARIAVMGGSAGGGHAAMLAIAARDRGEVPIALQVLVYPMLDDRTGSSRAVPDFIGTIIWTAQSNRYGWSCFLGRVPGGDDAPAGSVPARVADLSGLPPAWIGVGSVDLFVSEDVEYARRLIEAGVACELMVVPGAFHGFEGAVPDCQISRTFVAAQMDALRRGLGVEQG